MTLQQMMMVMGDGGGPTACTDPSGWTLIEKWDSRLGDLDDLATAMGTAWQDGFAWSYDGTKLTIANAVSDFVHTIICSTPFDPSTASTTVAAEFAITNPSSIQFNDDGSLIYLLRNPHDFIYNIAADDFVVDGNTLISFINKAQAGFTGASEGGQSLSVDDVNILWEGTTGLDEELKEITMDPVGDLGAFTVDATEGINPPVVTVTHSIGMSVQSLDRGNFYKTNASISLATMSTPGDLSTLSYGSFIDLNTIHSLNFLVVRVWINPNDTSEVWVGGLTSGMQLARFATNV